MKVGGLTWAVALAPVLASNAKFGRFKIISIFRLLFGTLASLPGFKGQKGGGEGGGKCPLCPPWTRFQSNHNKSNQE